MLGAQSIQQSLHEKDFLAMVHSCLLSRDALIQKFRERGHTQEYSKYIFNELRTQGVIRRIIKSDGKRLRDKMGKYCYEPVLSDGDIGTGRWSHSRWCAGHSTYHGALYVCECYGDKLKIQVLQDSERFARSLIDPTWVQQQLDNGIPVEAIAIYRIFEGI